MKVGIVGAGAMGSVYGALMADAGHEVWMFDKWQAHVDAMRTKGLRVEGASGDRTVPIHATADAAEAGPCGLVIVATKGHDTDAAVGAARAMIGPETAVLSLQNGLGNVEKIQSLLGGHEGGVLAGIAGGFGASMIGPGHAHHNGMSAINIAEAAGGLTDRLERVRDVWTSSGFNCETFADIWPVVWSKLNANIAVSATCTLFGLRTGEVRENPHAWELSKTCVLETSAVAAAKGIALLYDDPVQWVSDFIGKMPKARPSMYQDVLAGRRSEIDTIHGGVVAEGERLGVPTPTCAFMVTAVRALQEKARQQGDAYQAS
ncbi:MAG: 2-dehydropantoate 2-reductase [Alphaproteobacteria bacterium]|nr:2-dehydropantoate 2-reductase [Alphaproteobacteria bacterium]MCB9928490.1 2-dehydropantoate 2-reductase [Alphaproteobacteria bacterium]